MLSILTFASAECGYALHIREKRPADGPEREINRLPGEKRDGSGGKDGKEAFGRADKKTEPFGSVFL